MTRRLHTRSSERQRTLKLCICSPKDLMLWNSEKHFEAQTWLLANFIGCDTFQSTVTVLLQAITKSQVLCNHGSDFKCLMPHLDYHFHWREKSWATHINHLINSESGYPFVNILCEPKPVSAATLQANHWCPLPRPKQVANNNFRQGSQVGSLVLAMEGWCNESFLMNASKNSTACPHSRKSTHLMPENTDNAGGLVVIYVVFGNGIEELKTRNPFLEKL